MLHDGEIERARVLHRATHQLGVHHRLAVVGDGHAASLLELPHLGQLLAGEPLGDGADRVDPHHPRLACAVDDQLGHRAAVVGRRGVRHRADGREPARRRRTRPGDDVLFVLLPRLAQVGVQIDEPGHDPLPAHVDHAHARTEAGGDPGADLGDDAVLQQNVRLGVKTAPRIEDPAATQTEIHLPGPLVRGLGRLSQPVSPCLLATRSTRSTKTRSRLNQTSLLSNPGKLALSPLGFGTTKTRDAGDRLALRHRDPARPRRRSTSGRG